MSFLEGYIESLSEIGIEEGSVDLIISNCVVNLSVNKEAVLKQLHRALAFGGEFQFSDVFSDQVLPQAVRTHKVLVGECLGGAMEESEFLALAQETGFLRPQMVTKKEIEVRGKRPPTAMGGGGMSAPSLAKNATPCFLSLSLSRSLSPSLSSFLPTHALTRPILSLSLCLCV